MNFQYEFCKVYWIWHVKRCFVGGKEWRCWTGMGNQYGRIGVRISECWDREQNHGATARFMVKIIEN